MAEENVSNTEQQALKATEQFLDYLDASLATDTPPAQRQPFKFGKFWEGSKKMQRLNIGGTPILQHEAFKPLYSKLGRNQIVWEGTFNEIIKAHEHAHRKHMPSDLVREVRVGLDIAVALGMNQDTDDPNLQRVKEVIDKLVTQYQPAAEANQPAQQTKRGFIPGIVRGIFGSGKPREAQQATETPEQRKEREKVEFFAEVGKYDEMVTALEGHEDDPAYAEAFAEADNLGAKLELISNANITWFDEYQAGLDSHPDQTAAEQTRTNEAAERRQRLVELLDQWQEYPAAQLQDIDLQARQKLLENTARFIYDADTPDDVKEALIKMITRGTPADAASFVLIMQKLGFTEITDEEQGNAKATEESFLSSVKAAQQAARPVATNEPSVEAISEQDREQAARLFRKLADIYRGKYPHLASSGWIGQLKYQLAETLGLPEEENCRLADIIAEEAEENRQHTFI